MATTSGQQRPLNIANIDTCINPPNAVSMRNSMVMALSFFQSLAVAAYTNQQVDIADKLRITVRLAPMAEARTVFRLTWPSSTDFSPFVA